MWKKIIISLVCLIPTALWAAEFVASVSSNTVDVGQRLVLNLTLRDADAVESPDLSGLIREFVIYTQQRYTNYGNYNGVVSAESGWDITLLPKIDGELTIPSLVVETNKGTLKSQEIKVKVNPVGGGSSTSNQPNKTTDSLGVSFVASVNKVSAYVKEPIIYTLKIISYRNLVNVVLEDIKSADAIIDKIGTPKQYEQILGGVRAHIIELTYYVTPITAGKIVITPAVIKGEVQDVPRQQSVNHRFGMLNNFFFDNVVDFRPFELHSDKITINALPPAVNTADWLPLQGLQLTEEWQGLNKAKVGDTIIRKVKLTATGGFSNQLPSVQSFMDVPNLKSYPDKPVLSDKVLPNNSGVIGTKDESFSLVALQPGDITLPAIKITWWNTKTKKTETSILPAKTINVLPGVAGANNTDTAIDYSLPVETKNSSSNSWVAYVIAGLILVIVSMFAVIVYLLTKKNTKPVVIKPVSKDKVINTAEDLKTVVSKHASKYWHAPEDLPLNQLGSFLTEHDYMYDIEKYIAMCGQINSELYAKSKVTMDIKLLITSWEQFKQSVTKTKNENTKQDKSGYINLNPT